MEVLKSKSFQSSIAGFIVLLLVNFFPEFSRNQEQLTYAIAFIIGALIAGHKTKDIMIAWVNAGAKRANVEDELFKLEQAKTEKKEL